jgi:hypothetical protein
MRLRVGFLALFLSVGGAVFSPLAAKDLGVDSLTLVWSPGLTGLTASWDTMETASTQTFTFPPVFYRVCRYPGYTTSTTTIVGSGSCFSTQNTSVDGYGAGAASFVIVGTDTATGRFDYSPIRYSHLIHRTLSPISQDIVFKDQDNSRNGGGQQWRFDYKLQLDAYMTIAIYPPGVVFSTDSVSGFVVSASSAPVKTILDNTPRSEQMAGDVFLNTDFWDLRNSSGTIVPKGLYSALFTARSSSDGTTISDTVVRTIPNDSIRLYTITSTPITDTATSSSLGFSVNANARVKLIICTPGTKFTVAASAGSLPYLTGQTYTYIAGDIVPLHPTTLLVDGSRLLRVLDFNVASGSHIFPWNGADQVGTILASGMYPFGISAEDSFGGHAVDLTGNNYAQWGSIPINRSSMQFQAVAANSLSPQAGQILTTPFSRLAISLGPTMDGVTVDGNRSTVVLTGPDHRALPGVNQWNSQSNVLEYRLDKSPTQTGDYKVEVTARGSVLAHGPFESRYESFFTYHAPDGLKEENTYITPSPVKNVTEATFHFGLANPSEVRLRVFNILGELLYERSESRGSGHQTLGWNLANQAGQVLASGVYIYSLEAEGRQVKKKFMVIQ